MFFLHELHQYEVSNLLCKGILDRKYGIHTFFLCELFQHVILGSIFGTLHHKDGTELFLVCEALCGCKIWYLDVRDSQILQFQSNNLWNL